MHCLICQNQTQIKQDPRTESAYHFCNHCGFISKDSKNHPTPKEEFQIYELHENSIEDPRYVAFFEKFLQAAVFPFTTGGKKALDFGSGPSPVLAQLMERDYDYYYTIYDKFYAPDTTYNQQQYDLITTTEVVEHLADPLPVFKKLSELLVAGGILSVMTLFPPLNEADFFSWYYMSDITHLSFYRPQTMALIAQKMDLEMIYCDQHRYTTFKKKGNTINNQ